MLKWVVFSKKSEKQGGSGKFRSFGDVGKTGDLPMVMGGVDL
jgi:hypothetical protein